MLLQHYSELMETNTDAGEGRLVANYYILSPRRLPGKTAHGPNDRYAIGKHRVAAVEHACLNAATDIIFIAFGCLCDPSP